MPQPTQGQRAEAGRGLQHGCSVAESTKPTRITENIDVFDFELGADEVAALSDLETGKCGGAGAAASN